MIREKCRTNHGWVTVLTPETPEDWAEVRKLHGQPGVEFGEVPQNTGPTVAQIAEVGGVQGENDERTDRP